VVVVVVVRRFVWRWQLFDVKREARQRRVDVARGGCCEEVVGRWQSSDRRCVVARTVAALGCVLQILGGELQGMQTSTSKAQGM
jgi:hypothetical protein